ncbi:MAG: hypothetical protein WEB05_02365 [Solirubrobacterales bacterium]
MDDSTVIITLLRGLDSRLDSIEADLGQLADLTTDLQNQGALMADDMAEIRRDINRLEPGII